MALSHIQEFAPQWEWERDMPPASIVRAGNTLYLSGQIALAPDGTLVGEGDLPAQAEQIFLNIQSVLARAGATMDNVVKMVTYYTVEMTPERVQAYWEVRRRFFPDYQPASTGVYVAGLIDPRCLLEIEVIAVLP